MNPIGKILPIFEGGNYRKNTPKVQQQPQVNPGTVGGTGWTGGQTHNKLSRLLDNAPKGEMFNYTESIPGQAGRKDGISHLSLYA